MMTETPKSKATKKLQVTSEKYRDGWDSIFGSRSIWLDEPAIPPTDEDWQIINRIVDGVFAQSTSDQRSDTAE